MELRNSKTMRERIANFLLKLAEKIHPAIQLNKVVYVESEKPKPTATAVVDQILDRPIVFFRWQMLSPQERRNWGAEAKAALSNRALQAIFGKSALLGEEATNGEYVKIVIEDIARYSRSQEQTDNMRHLIIGVEKMREMLEDMCVERSEPQEVKEPNATF